MINNNKILIICVCIILISSEVLSGKMIYDRHQEGDVNVQADLKNILVVFVPTATAQQTLPGPGPYTTALLTMLLKKAAKKTPDTDMIEDRSSPYRVDITQERLNRLQHL